jgi:hypothetical protein
VFFPPRVHGRHVSGFFSGVAVWSSEFGVTASAMLL